MKTIHCWIVVNSAQNDGLYYGLKMPYSITNYIETPSNHVLSMFGRRSLADEIQDAYDNDKVLDQNKEKIRRLREKLDSQWSTSKLNQTDFNNSINNYKKIVKQYSRSNKKSEGQMSLRERDEEYMKAVESGDMETAQLYYGLKMPYSITNTY